MGRVRSTITVLLFGAGFVLAAAFCKADSLVLRDGDRLEGTLVQYDGNTIEFRESGLFGKVRRFEREDVQAIEFSGRDREARSSGRTRGLREKEVRVQAGRAWTNTGIDVRRGQEIHFTSSGKIQWGKGRRDDAGGEGGKHYNANRPIPNRPAAALIGKVGQGSTDFFFIGKEESPFRMRSSGRLFLGINDDYLNDNSGSFRVLVFY
ncbi:MAG: hypothetical protein JXO72_11850 [Vicinamibacteria bacterium]|nr:hypothetical protein [Vicinamibacteria bacterium]